MSDDPPVWQKLAAALYVLIVVALVLAFRDRIGTDFWPPDRSIVGPNILAEVVTILVATPVGVLLWPPTRRRLHRFVDRKLAAQHEHNRWMAQHLADLYEQHMGRPASPHPHFDLTAAPSQTRSKENP